MKRVDIKELKPGAALPRGLYAASGARLVAPGVTLTHRMVHALRARPDRKLYTDPEYPLPGRSSAATAQLEPPPTDEPTGKGTPDAPEELLEAACAHLDGVADAAKRRRIASLCARTRRAGELCVNLRAARWEKLPRRVRADEAPTDDSSLSRALSFPLQRAFYIRRRAEEIHRLVTARLLACHALPSETVFTVADELLDAAQRWPRTFTSLAFSPHADASSHEPASLHQQAFRAAVVTTAIARQLRFSPNDVRAAATAAFLADIGMATLAGDFRAASRSLEDTEYNRLRQHPEAAVAMLENITDLPDTIRLAVYQHHEREDGSGYPNAARGGRIHDYARVAAVADSLAAAVEPRAYRPPRQPTLAIWDVLGQAASGRLWRHAARALADACGLFPIGTRLRLSDGSLVRVVAPGSRASRPIVERCGGAPHEPPVDLSAAEAASLKVVAAVDLPPQR